MVRSRSGHILYAVALASSLLYIFIAYFIQRHQSLLLIGSYTLLFTLFLTLWYYARTQKQVRWLILLGVLFRLMLLLAFPNLSDDIYRFVWDGRLMQEGIHPFSQLPAYYMTSGSPDVPGITSRLFYLLNSPHYFTIYPPVAQLFFWFSVHIFPDSVHGSAIVIRSLIIVVEVGSLWVMILLLRHYKRSVKPALLYALNPLIILELTGNLHFEAFMIFFLLLGIYFFLKNRYIITALMMAFAVATKLLPLIFMLLFIRRMPFRELIRFYALTVIFTVILFLPLMHPDLLKGMESSLGLYFQKFEFNASIYYLIREMGFYAVGYNIIQVLGIYLAPTTFIFIIAYALLHGPKKVRLPEAMLWVLVIYFLLTTTLHPWYIATLLAVSVFTKFRFPVVWSFFIFLTYAGYSQYGFEEILWLTAVEYGIVIVYMLYEIYKYYILPYQSPVC